MFLSFAIQNFKSILDLTLSTEFNESAPNGYRDKDTHIFLEESKKRVSPILSIYGANASGKSNIIEAFEIFYYLIVGGIKNTVFIPNKINNKYSDTKFAIKVMLNGKEYEYSISYNNETIAEELLKCNKKILISCKNQEIEEIFETSGFYNKETIKEIYQVECKDIKQKQIIALFSKIAQKLPNLKPEITVFYNYLMEKVDICTEQPRSNIKSLQKLANELGSEELALKEIAKLVKKFDIDIEDILYEEKQTLIENFSEIPFADMLDIDRQAGKVNYSQFYTFHKSLNDKYVRFNLQEESKGTQTLIPIICTILTVLAKGGVLFVDELDRSLHPLLLIQLTRLFKDKRYNKKNAQLIFTLHCTDLLEDDLIRKSEIGIVSKTRKNGSTFTKLSAYKDLRNVLDFRKRYLMGEFSGIPYAYI